MCCIVCMNGWKRHENMWIHFLKNCWLTYHIALSLLIFFTVEWIGCIGQQWMKCFNRANVWMKRMKYETKLKRFDKSQIYQRIKVRCQWTNSRTRFIHLRLHTCVNPIANFLLFHRFFLISMEIHWIAILRSIDKFMIFLVFFGFFSFFFLSSFPKKNNFIATHTRVVCIAVQLLLME